MDFSDKESANTARVLDRPRLDADIGTGKEDEQRDLVPALASSLARLFRRA